MMLCFRGCRRGSLRWFRWRSRRIRDGEPMHGHAEQAAKPHPSPTPNLFCPVHLISRRDAAFRVSICESVNLATNKKPATPAHPYGPRNRDGAPVSPVWLPVTEVYLPGISFHPAPLNLAAAPETRHP